MCRNIMNFSSRMGETFSLLHPIHFPFIFHSHFILNTQHVLFFHRFNLVRFSTEAVPWKPNLVPTSDETCQEAVEWVSEFEANGSTCTLEALQTAFDDLEVQGIYLLTDGKPVSEIKAQMFPHSVVCVLNKGVSFLVC